MGDTRRGVGGVADAGRHSSPALQKALGSRRHMSRSFDGNRTDLMVEWFFRSPGAGVGAAAIQGLLDRAADGDLYWAIFPVDA